MMNSRTVFESKNINKTFGPTRALEDVSITLGRGEVYGLIGENGSGKSTLATIIAGLQPPDYGEMFLNGEPYAPKSVLSGTQKGVCMIIQEQGTFAEVTVAQNLFVGKESEFYKSGILSIKKMSEEAKGLLHKHNIFHIDPDQPTFSVSYEDRKLIEVVRAMYTEPSILIIDETTSALSKRGRDILYSIMKHMKEIGKTVVFISHDIEELMEHCDVLTILKDGVYVDRLTKDKFDVDRIKQLMVGREMVGSYYRSDYGGQEPNKEIALKAEGICEGFLEDISLTAYKNEILGVGGLNESGMHQLGKILFGLTKPERGQMLYEGHIKYKTASQAMSHGIGYMSKDRDKEAVMTEGSIKDNICLPSLKKLRKGVIITNKSENEFSENYADILEVKRNSIDQLCMHLSGGNKQKVIIAKWIGFGSKILIMDCPTRGIDIGVKAEIYKLMVKIRNEGNTIILISEELSELIGMSDRILLMKEGKINAEFTRQKDMKDNDLIDYMI
ncbi:sugar ABC transporter ATP-binding protein [Diplocloster modestus]|uniref:Sugar ABC transporter ATP-binding protein n=1 Tax=Diplocloster modestus TaxID=2850322 RepID=A0ABS6KF08_9FIRM|nr:sugar ABC transporter ATP-binding protein [Diplocloster modestus]MBU9729094.1 sugar ABC transporter ATP-binding protein [Diplocloster modestus]